MPAIRYFFQGHLKVKYIFFKGLFMLTRLIKPDILRQYTFDKFDPKGRPKGRFTTYCLIF